MTLEIQAAWLEQAGLEQLALSGNCSFGRSAGNTVVIHSPQASRRHAIIHSQNLGEFWLLDLGSSNGTFLNKRRVQQPTKLCDQDRIAIGDRIFIFRQSESFASATRSTLAELTLRHAQTINCWLLVADIQDFTPLSRTLNEQQLATVIGGWLSLCNEIIEKNNGIVNKYLGDGFLAYWQDQPMISKDVAASVASLTQVQTDVRFRIALHFGSVTVGAVPALSEVSLIGKEVNFVFRMEKLAGSLGVKCLLSSQANGQLGHPYRTIGMHELKGFEGAHAFFAPQP